VAIAVIAAARAAEELIIDQQFPVAIFWRKFVGILIFCFVIGAVMMLAWISQFTSQAKGFAQYGSLGKEGTTGSQCGWSVQTHPETLRASA